MRWRAGLLLAEITAKCRPNGHAMAIYVVSSAGSTDDFP
jgi:hypothetical protein